MAKVRRYLSIVSIFLTYLLIESTADPPVYTERFCTEELAESAYPGSALIPCKLLDRRFIECEDIAQTKLINTSINTREELCSYFGTSKGPLLHVNITCSALPCIECSGPRKFMREFPCRKYTGHYYITTLTYSIFLGLLAVDRFYLGYSAIAIGKLMTMGGLGIWWIADIVLLLSGNLMPADDSDWQPCA